MLSSRAPLNKLSLWCSVLLLFMLCCAPLSAYKLFYAEEYYNLYHVHMYDYPENGLEQIYYLQKALTSPHVNPVNALTHITTHEQWKMYRTLFRLHVLLLLTKEELRLGDQYDKRGIYFYNYPYKSAILGSLKKAHALYLLATPYWQEAQKTAQLATSQGSTLADMDGIESWNDERAQIMSGKLDYGQTISRVLKHNEHSIKQLTDMKASEYVPTLTKRVTPPK